MLSSINHRRSFPFIAIIVAILLQSVSAQAQSPGSGSSPCSCSNPVELKTLDICIDSTTYNVTVYGCGSKRTSTPLLADPCDNGLLQNQYSNITKVCFNGPKPVIIDATKTFSAILCKMSPATVDSAWDNAVIPPTLGTVWCWSVMTPKCVTVNQATGCIERCGTKCCIFQMRWTQTINGIVYDQPFPPCVRGGTCNQYPCQEIECPTRDLCCGVD